MSKDSSNYDDGERASAMASVVTSPLSFADVANAAVREHPLEAEIGDAQFKAIGEIMVLWAHAVWQLENIVCCILGIGRKEARIAAGERELPVGKSIDRVRDLMLAMNREPPNIADLKGRLMRCETSRNLVAHGVWLKDNESGKIGIQDVRQEWDFPSEDGKKKVRHLKRISPQLRFLEEEDSSTRPSRDQNCDGSTQGT